MDQQQAPDRNLAMDLARATEAAALAAGRWLGRGDKNGADGAAVDAMRLVLNTVPMEGVVVIGEGEKDEAPMLFNGEEIGSGGPACDIAVDPIDGTTLTSLGRNNAISVIALAERGTMFDPGPCVYMDKIAVGPEARDVVDLDAPVKANLHAVAKAKGERVEDVTAITVAIPSSTQRKSPNQGNSERLTTTLRCESPARERASHDRAGTASIVAARERRSDPFCHRIEISSPSTARFATARSQSRSGRWWDSARSGTRSTRARAR